MNRTTTFLWALALVCTACTSGPAKQDDRQPTPQQQQLAGQGWQAATPDEDMTEAFGYKPVFGMQDNYFDIAIGEGFDIAVKIVDAHTGQCIRYLYVAGGTTTTAHEIPQGDYFLKIAYGQDWMELRTDTATYGKFTRNATYEQSREAFSFGAKNSQAQVSYRLEIHIEESRLANNFATRHISEAEFMQ